MLYLRITLDSTDDRSDESIFSGEIGFRLPSTRLTSKKTHRRLVRLCFLFLYLARRAVLKGDALRNLERIRFHRNNRIQNLIQLLQQRFASGAVFG